MEVVKNILKVAKDNGYTDSQICKLLKKNTGYVNDWKRGKSKPKADELVLLANTFRCSIDFLLGYSSENINFSSDEIELLSEFKKLDLKGKSAVMQTILNEQKRMNKNSISQDMKETITSVENLPITTKQK